MEVFTRYIEAVPIKDEMQDTLVQAFLEARFFSFGAPDKRLSDKGASFTLELIEAVCKILGVKSIQTCMDQFQGNDAVERYNKNFVTRGQSANYD